MRLLKNELFATFEVPRLRGLEGETAYRQDSQPSGIDFSTVYYVVC